MIAAIRFARISPARDWDRLRRRVACYGSLLDSDLQSCLTMRKDNRRRKLHTQATERMLAEEERLSLSLLDPAGLSM